MPGELTVLSQALLVGTVAGLVYALVSTGFSLTFGLMRVVNFGHGAFVMAGMYFALELFHRYGISPYWSALAAIPTAFVSGSIIYRYLFQPILSKPLEMQFLVGIGIAIVAENASLYLFGSDIRGVNIEPSTYRIGVGDVGMSMAQLIASVGAILLACLLTYAIYRTAFGRRLRAVAQDPEAARLCGVRVERTNLVAFGIGTAAAGIAGALIIPFSTVAPTTGLDFSLRAFMVLVIAGVGSIPGLIVAGVLLGVTESVSGAYLPSAWAQVIALGVVVLVMIIRPQGVFRRETW
ncbi:MAG: branched-chain amino acid ABC transporter permease [Dehalococcoidia bacterium]